MKKLALILSILLIAGLNVEAQKRQARSSAPKSYKKSESAKKSTKKSKPAATINSRKSVSSKARRATPVTKRSNSRSVATRSNRNSSSRSATARSNRSSKSRSVTVRTTNTKSISRSDARRSDRRVSQQGNRRIGGKVDLTARNGRYNNRYSTVNRRPVSVIRTPRVTNIRVRHGYVDYSRRRYGYSAHLILNFPMRVRYPFYHNHHLVLMHSYRPQVEHPWAIYESEGGDNTASIEGKVMDIDYNRRTNQYVIHFGCKSPYQSATVIIPDYIARHINYRSLKKLKRDYVSVFGLFTNYGNVPTIIIDSLDEFYVDEISLREFLYYN